MEAGASIADGETSSERWYVSGRIQQISDPFYGQMVISDSTGSIDVYGTYGADGAKRYGELGEEEKPSAGDDVILYANLKNFQGTLEINSGWIVDFTDNTPTEDIDYVEMTNLEFREASEGSLAQLSGVVAQFTYNSSRVRNGFILVDETDSVYVYDMSVASRVEIGNTVTVGGTKDMFVTSSEASEATRLGYGGCLELTDCRLIANDGENSPFDTSWIEATTVKDIMETSLSENITGRIFKADVYVTKYVQESGDFTNYYLNDLDGTTGSYVYTQASGADFTWLDPYENHLVSMYFTPLNAKASSSGGTWRFLPISVIEDNITFDEARIPWFAVEYYGLNQLASEYTEDPAQVMATSVSSEILGFSGASLRFSSDNQDVAYFEETDGVITFHTGTQYGTATITVTGSYGTYEDYTDTFEVTYREKGAYNLVTIPEAIAMEVQDQATEDPIYIQGVVGPSLVNQPGFVLISEEGTIAVRMPSDDLVKELDLGNTVIVEGYRDLWHSTSSSYGEIVISNATVAENDRSFTPYSTESFLEDTITNISSLNYQDSLQTTQAYFSEAILYKSSGMYPNFNLVDPENAEASIRLYSSRSEQYSWIYELADNETVYRIQMIPVNFNSKDYITGLLMAVEVDGTFIYNELNFN